MPKCETVCNPFLLAVCNSSFVSSRPHDRLEVDPFADIQHSELVGVAFLYLDALQAIHTLN